MVKEIPLPQNWGKSGDIIMTMGKSYFISKYSQRTSRKSEIEMTDYYKWQLKLWN